MLVEMLVIVFDLNIEASDRHIVHGCDLSTLA
jgi:hypothetical protein